MRFQFLRRNHQNIVIGRLIYAILRANRLCPSVSFIFRRLVPRRSMRDQIPLKLFVALDFSTLLMRFGFPIGR